MPGVACNNAKAKTTAKRTLYVALRGHGYKRSSAPVTGATRKNVGQGRFLPCTWGPGKFTALESALPPTNDFFGVVLNPPPVI